jgi:hypothetical protein
MSATYIERQVAFLMGRGWHGEDAHGTGDIIATSDAAGLVILSWDEYDTDGAVTPRTERTGLTVDQYARAVS